MPHLDPKLQDCLESLYARIPSVNCQRKCQADCTLLGMYPIEAARIEETLGKPLGMKKDGHCSALSEAGTCTIYAVRPLICRLYGAIRALRCKHGCAPKRFLTVEETLQITEEVRLLSELAGFGQETCSNAHPAHSADEPLSAGQAATLAHIRSLLQLWADRS